MAGKQLIPFRGLFQNDIAAAERALAETEARIAQLEAERTAALAGDAADYVAQAAKISRELEALRSTAAAHRERIAALRERERKAEHERREQQRLAGIAAIKKLLPARAAAAAKLDRALAAVAEAVAELEAADKAVFADWPAVLPLAHTLRYCSTLNGDALSTVRKERPLAPGVIRLLVEKLPLFDFAAETAKRNAELVTELEASPVVEQEAA